MGGIRENVPGLIQDHQLVGVADGGDTQLLQTLLVCRRNLLHGGAGIDTEDFI